MLAALSRLMYGASRPSRRGSSLVESDDTVSPVVRVVRWFAGAVSMVESAAVAFHAPPPYLLLPITQREPETGHAHSQRFSEQQLALLPVSANGPVRDAQGLCNLGLGQAAEVAQLDDLGQTRIERGELVERLMDGEDLFRAAAALVGKPRRQRHVRRASAAPIGGAAARKVDDDRPHHASGPSQEVHSVLEVQGTGRRKAQIRFVHQRTRIEQRVATPGQPPPCQLAEIGVGRGEQPLSRVGIAILGAVNQIGQVDRIVHGR